MSSQFYCLTRKHKGGIKIHTLYDLGTQKPAIFHIPQHQSITAMKEIPIKTEAYYSSNQNNNNFMELYR